MGAQHARLRLAAACAAFAALATPAVADPRLPAASGLTCPVAPFPVTVAAGALRTLAADRGLTLGAAVRLDPLRKDQAYRDALVRDFTAVVPENELKMARTRPAQHVFDFCEADQIVAFAQANGLAVRGVPLVWHHRLPAWITDREWTREELTEVLREHVTTTVRHFRGRVAQWDVVNEPVSEDGYDVRRSIWYRVIGPDYVELALRWAREADPDAKLYVNEYGTEHGGRRAETFLTIVRDLARRHVPLDGVGLQGHLDANRPTGKPLRRLVAEIEALGLGVAFTEVDVGAHPAALSHERMSPHAMQATAYRELLDTCLRAMRCRTFMTWGVTDAYSWRAQEQPLLIDASYAPKAAYDALVDRLRR